MRPREIAAWTLALLPPAWQAGLREHEKGYSKRMMASQTERDLSFLKLDPGQMAEVRDAMVQDMETRMSEECRKQGLDPSEMSMFRSLSIAEIKQARQAMKGTTGGAPDYEQTLGMQRKWVERSLAAVQPHLTPEQFERYRKRKEGELQMMEMQVRAMTR